MAAFQGLTNLEPLVRLVDVQNFNFRVVLVVRGPQVLGQLVQSLELVPGGHKDEFGRFAG